MYLESSSSFVDGHQGNIDDLYYAVQLADSHCRVRVETSNGPWLLEATHAGKIRLEFNGVPVARMSSLMGAALLRDDGCPFERAAEILDALCIRSCLCPSATVRIELEYGLARWIPMYFEL